MSVETLDVTSAINVVQDAYGSNKYVLNGNTTYNSNTKYSLDVGTYQITGIPTSHPLAIVDISDSNFLTYTGLTANKTIKDGEDYYTGNITVHVTGNFGTASIKCSNHGYMGGQNLLQYAITEQEVDNNVVDTSGNISYINASIYSATSSKITKKHYKDLKGNSEVFFNERVRIKSNNIICSNSDKTIEIQHTKNDQIFVIGSKSSNGSSAFSQSKDGLFWSPISTTVFTHVRGIKYSPESELWIACGSGTNTLAYSIDGKNWVGLGKTVFSDVAYSVSYGNGTWVAVGGNTPNTIAYSSDGFTWTGVGNSIFTNCGKAIGYGNGMWIAGGQGANTLAYSVNGINWTGLGETIFDEQCNVVKHADNMWVAGGGNDIPNTLAYSTDGLNWTGRRYNNIRHYTYGLDYANNMWIAGGGKKDEGYSGGTVRNWVLVSDSIPNWNGSFEDPVVNSFGPLNSTHNNLEITGWSWSVPSNASGSALYGPAFGSNPWNGTPVAGSGNQQVGLRYQQALYKTITGTLKHGSVYQLKLMAITRYGQYDQSRPDPTIKVYYNGTEIYEFSLRMMDGDLPVLIDNILFTASGNNHEIKFEHQHNEDYTMMMDDIQLFEDTYSATDVSASDLSGITISPSVVGTNLSGTSWILKSITMNNWNGGFETDELGINQFVKMGRDDPFNGVLTGWTYTTGNHSAWGPTLINSNNSSLGNQAIIHGTQMIGLRYNQTLTKTLSNLETGKSYKLRYQRHARVAQTNIEYRVYLDSTSNILKQEIVTTAASEVEANRLVEIDFTAGSPQQTITIEQLSGGDNMIWFDKFELYEDQSSGSWDTTAAITNVEWKEISDAINDWNGSFESDVVSAGTYYIIGSTTNGSNNGPTALTGWTQETANESYGAVLVNTYTDQMYDNSQYNGGLTSGAIIQGNQAVGIHLETKLKKTINDLVVGNDYKLSYEVFKFDKSQGQVNYNVQLDSESTLLKLSTEITHSQNSTRTQRTHTVNFRATQTSHTIIFAAASGVTWNMFFLDNVKLYERTSGQAIIFGETSKIPNGTIGLETADDNVFDNNWTTNYDNTIMLDLDFDAAFANQGLTIALAGSAGPSTNYAPNSGPLKWHYNLDSVTGGLQSNQTLIPGIYNATYDLTFPNSTYTKALGIGAYGNTGVIVSKTFTNNTTVRVVYGYGRIDSTTGADLGGVNDGASATIKVAGVQKDATTEVQKTVTFDVNSGETMEIVGSLLLYAIEFFPKLYAATNTFILTGSSKSLTDINNSSIALELVGNPNFTAENGVELTGETSKYIKIPQSIMNFGAGDFSVSLWIKNAVYTSTPSTASGGWANGCTLLSMDFNAHINSTGGFVLTTALAENDRRIYVHDQISTSKTATSNFNYGDDSGLHNYVITRKGNTIRLFIDNVEEASYDHAPPANYPNADDTNYIGLMLWSNSPSRPLKGNITKFEVWGDAGFDVWPPPAPDTPSGDSGSNAATHSFILSGASRSLTDVNNSDLSLELIGNPTFSDENGVSLTGTTSKYIKIPQSVMNVGTNDYTLSIWIKNAVTGSSQQMLISMENHAHRMPPRGGAVLQSDAEQKIGYRSRMLKPDATNLTNNAVSDYVYGTDSDLHNYVVSRKGTVTRVFIDNVEKASFDDVPTYPTNEYDDNYIGVMKSSNSPAYPLTGDIMKFEVWLGQGFDTWPPEGYSSGDSSGSEESAYTWATPAGPPYDLTANVLKPYTGNVVSRPYLFENFYKDAVEVSESSSEIPATNTIPSGEYKTYKFGDEYIRTGVLNLYINNSIPMYNYVSAFFDRMDSGDTSFSRKGRYIWQSDPFTNITFAGVTVNGAAQYFTFLSSDTTKVSYVRVFNMQDRGSYFNGHTSTGVNIYGTNDDVTATLLGTNSSLKTEFETNAANAISNNLYTNYTYTTPQGSLVDDVPAYVDITLDSSAETTGYKKYYIAYTGTVSSSRVLGGWVQFYYNLPAGGSSGSGDSGSGDSGSGTTDSNAATNSFILSGASRSLTDVNNSNISLELFGNPTFGTDGVELTDTLGKYIKVPQSILMFGSNDFTVSVSIKDAVYTGNSEAWILGFGVNYHVVHDHIGRYFFLGYSLNRNGGIVMVDRLGVQDGVPLTVTEFNYIYGSDSNEHTYTISRKDGNMYFFLDNELRNTPYAQPGPLRQDDQNFIGGGYQSNSISRPITGKITKFEVWDSVGFDTWPPPVSNGGGDSSGSGSNTGLTADEWNAQYGSTVFNTVNSGYLDDSALFAAVTANNIKVIVQSWNWFLSMNWGVYVDGVLENPSFANRENSSHYPVNDGLNYEDSTLDSGNSWVAGSNSVGEWTMIKYSTPQTFTGVKITPRQMGNFPDMYITSFKLEFSSNGLTAAEWNAQYGSTIFNTNSGYLDDSALFAAVTANNIKVVVQSWNSYLALNWGVYVDGVLENPSFANRENSSYFTGNNTYNYEDSTLDSGNSWVAGSNSVGQWTMIKYSTPQTFTGVKITPRQSGSYTEQHITSFKLEFS